MGKSAHTREELRGSLALPGPSPIGLTRWQAWDHFWRPHTAALKGGRVAGKRTGGIGLGGILVVLGIVLIIVWSFWWGLIIGLIGLVVFGGFAKGKWY
jgi:hypothetical protein